MKDANGLAGAVAESGHASACSWPSGLHVWTYASVRMGEGFRRDTCDHPYLRACATITAIYGITHTRACIL